MVQDRMEKVEEYQQMQSKYKTEMDKQMINLRMQMEPLTLGKLDITKYEEFVAKTKVEFH